MSDEDDALANPKDVIVEEVTEQVDVVEVITGDVDVAEQLDGPEFGSSVGRSLGGALGRRVGRSAGRRVHRILRDRDGEEGDRSRLGRLLRAFVTAAIKTLGRPEYREPIGDALRSYVEEREDGRGGDEANVEESDDGGDEAGLTGATPDALPSDLDEVKRETYRDLLEVMSYRDLQSVAKEVGVKANAEREEMIDAIVESFAESDDEDDGGDGADTETDEGGDADTAGADEDEADEDGAETDES